MMDPTAIPAFAPVERPLPDEAETGEDVALGIAVAGICVAPVDDAVGFADVVGSLKSAEVTLKQGT